MQTPLYKLEKDGFNFTWYRMGIRTTLSKVQLTENLGGNCKNLIINGTLCKSLQRLNTTGVTVGYGGADRFQLS